MKKPTKKRITAAVLTGLAAVLLIWTIWENHTVGVTEITVTNPDLPPEFDGYTIAQVSDLHNSHLTEETLDILWGLFPSLIAVTGDVVDSEHTDLETAQDFFMEAQKIAPCCYVTGNHEALLPPEDYLWLEQNAYCNTYTSPDSLIDGESRVLHDAGFTVRRKDAEITILGVDDPAFITDSDTMDAPELDAVSPQLAPQELRELAGDAGFTILLSHRPELFENYVQAGMDLVLSGHAHGGQFRLPFIGGICAPDQGFFPEYDAGLYAKDNTQMVVSRGIGNSIIPIRFHNQPEIVLITLRCGALAEELS